MDRNRKAAKTIGRTQALVSHIKEKALFTTDGQDCTIAEICCAMGAVDTFTQDPAQYFEDDFFEYAALTQMETDVPIDEFDKKKAATGSKLFVLQFKGYMHKVYSNADSDLYHGFTNEMMMAGYGIINALAQTEKHKFLATTPPNEAFVNLLTQATASLETLKHFQWKRELYQPQDGKDEPPSDRSWKATPAGLAFMRNNPGSGSVAPIDRFAETLLQIANTTTNVTQNNSFFVRVYTDDFAGTRRDLMFDDSSINSSLRDAMKKFTGIHPKRGEEEVRLARVKLRGDSFVDLSSDCWDTTTLRSLVQSAGKKQGEVLEIASAVINRPTYSAGDITD